MFTNKVLLEHSHTLSFTCYFCAIMSGLSSCNRDGMFCKAQTFCYLMFYRKVGYIWGKIELVMEVSLHGPQGGCGCLQQTVGGSRELTWCRFCIAPEAQKPRISGHQTPPGTLEQKPWSVCEIELKRLESPRPPCPFLPTSLHPPLCGCHTVKCESGPMAPFCAKRHFSVLSGLLGIQAYNPSVFFPRPCHFSRFISQSFIARLHQNLMLH
jgi:hypothetical protein